MYLLREIGTLDGPARLTELARRAAQSPYHFHRRFRAVVGETPKAFTQRLRLLRAASRLATSDDTAGRLALASGFSSHEVFTRAFHRQFGSTPGRYRSAIRASLPQAARSKHFELSTAIAPCIRLFRLPTQIARRSCAMPILSIDRRQFDGQHLLLIRRRIARSELTGMLAECFGKLFSHGQKAGLPIAGWPLARYVVMGPGRWTVEAAMPLAAPAHAEADMEPGSLPAGPVVVRTRVDTAERQANTSNVFA